jgi:oxalate decarboxylase/phosphoglucose isomerase-like protein (cupin superfamily)
LRIENWGSFERVGIGYGFRYRGKFYSILETRVGAYRGNHIHPYDQHTILLSGKARYLKFEGGFHEVELAVGGCLVIKAGVPHVLLVDEDCLTFEWWDGDFQDIPCAGLFEEVVRGKVGPRDYLIGGMSSTK